MGFRKATGFLGLLLTQALWVSPRFGVSGTHSVFMLRMARRDMMASVTAFLNCLEQSTGSGIRIGIGIGSGITPGRVPGPSGTHLMARYMGRMAKSGKVCTLIMMVMKAM